MIVPCNNKMLRLIVCIIAWNIATVGATLDFLNAFNAFSDSTCQNATGGPRMNTSELIKAQCGADSQTQEFTVTAKDGYQTTLFRMLPKSNVTKSSVLLISGITCSSDTWFLKQSNSLPCILANAGYDVWMGNARGCRYGLKNLKLKSNDPAFWKFNLDDMGVNDTSAIVNFVYANGIQGQGGIFFLGYSMGGSMGLINTALDQDQQSKIKAMTLFSPGYSQCGAEAPLRDTPPELIDFTVLLTGGPLLPKTMIDVLNLYGSPFCAPYEPFCQSAYDEFGGYKEPTEYSTRQLACYIPDISGARPFQQILQSIKSCKFQRFDYGKQNMKKYGGSMTPPVYNLSTINIPVRLYYGLYEKIVRPAAMKTLMTELSKNGKVYPTELPIGHIDMVAGENVHTTIYNGVVNFFDNYLSPGIPSFN